jgi:hypothetical protein
MKAPSMRVIKGASAATAASTPGEHAHDGVECGYQLSAFQKRGQHCTVPVEIIRMRLLRFVDLSPYLQRFMEEPFLEEMLNDDRLRQLLSMRKAHKEITEAYAIANKVLAIAKQLAGVTGSEFESTTGKGFVVLDVCSGRGVSAVLMSFFLPDARIIMLDADGGMDLSHVSARPNLSFVPFDLFSGDAPSTITGLVGGDRCIAYGVHLCGALSPRLATLSCRLSCIEALVLCPCCLRGSLGRAVQKEAAKRGGGHAIHYPVLVETMADLCRQEFLNLEVVFDASVLSPKNGFITLIKET